MAITLPDWDDPCDVYAKLREAHHKLITAQGAQTIRYTSGGGQTEEVTFHKVNLQDLNIAMSKAQAECQASKTGKAQKFALSAGGSR